VGIVVVEDNNARLQCGLHDYLEGKETLAAENFGITSRQVYKYACTDTSMRKFYNHRLQFCRIHGAVT
jgi:hypothetical protein